MPPAKRWVVATPIRTAADAYARALEWHGALRLMLLGTRRGTAGIPPEHTRLLPALGLAAYACARLLSTSQGESARMALHPWFDSWVQRQLQPGDFLISSYGYANAAFHQVKRAGGHTFIDAGNSHPAYSWPLLEAEHRRWGVSAPPMPPHHYRRSLKMMSQLDFLFSPSQFVTQSFLQNGFRPEQILPVFYPVDLTLFTPTPTPRPVDRPLTVITTGSLSLRKGTPYLLEAFRLVLRQEPSARLLLTSVAMDNVREILRQYADLPIEWAPNLPHSQLVERLRSGDIYVLPSLEEGLARTALEALACGLPCILTPNTGANDYLREGENGSVVPICDAPAIAEAILRWWERLRTAAEPRPSGLNAAEFTQAAFNVQFITQLQQRGLLE